ncbi:MAG TPA: hypothetical protein VNO70_05915 [Blastocatellia bacterium]|nr:hypothetical protein [Blastocatellia bacterium]
MNPEEMTPEQLAEYHEWLASQPEIGSDTDDDPYSEDWHDWRIREGR